MCPPAWRSHRPARDVGKLAERDLAAGAEAAALRCRQLAAEILDVGVDVVCAPVLDLLFQETTRAIGDRAFSAEPAVCATLGRASMHALKNAGLVPVIKHLPGHGRGTVDSHEQLPIVDVDLATWRQSDAIPFRACIDAPMAMTGHLRFTAVDPVHPATTSATVIKELIRAELGFEGILFSDDLSMQALSGGIGDRAEAAIAAGCDLALHCNGNLDEMVDVLSRVPEMPASRYDALQVLAPRGDLASADLVAEARRLDKLLLDA